MSASDKSRTIHFSITGEFITQHARTMVLEENFSKAWDILIGCIPGLPFEQATLILMGRRKLVGTNDIDLADDDLQAMPDVTPEQFLVSMMKGADRAAKLEHELDRFKDVAGLAHVAYFPKKGTVSQPGKVGCGSPAGLLTPSVIRRLLDPDLIANLLMRVYPRWTDAEWEKFWDKPGNTEDIREVVESVHGSLYRREAPAPKARAEKLILASMPEPEPKPVEKPKPGTDYSFRNAWVLPNGDFYGFNDYAQHIYMANAIAGLEERDAEKKGWLKISSGPLGIYIGNPQMPKATQKQLDTLFDWSQVGDVKEREKEFAQFKEIYT